MEIYVNQNAERGGDGTKERPFQTISQAAKTARAGDRVLVAPGVYREWVDPQNGGTSEDCRVEYVSLEKGKAVITGAEVVKGWKRYDGDTWTVRVSNGLFGSYNPYATLVEGDWYVPQKPFHTGEVYLNGKSLYETETLEQTLRPEVCPASWDREGSLYKWFSAQDGDDTVLYANFRGADPNEETVEINVRRNCFYPSSTGRDYITLSGFTVKQAATQWAPPTAYQEGMVGPHWARGWIIEDCEISDSKCSGISLGKYEQPGNDNKWLHWKYKDGTQTERECICRAQAEGWSKETIGSHVVRRCDIHDCGQTGIVGHLGGVFSVIEDNHIHHINNKQNLSGAEIGGIKMHAAIDVVFRRNHIHHCTRGLWLDWQAQGTRVTQNLFHHNTLPNLEGVESPGGEMMQGRGEDIFVEVSHGPTLIDNNILLSTMALTFACQGVAVVHNLIAGSLVAVGKGTDNGAPTLPSPRYTPYHMIHRTEVAGFMTFLHGDMRFYNNIFVQLAVHPALTAAMDCMAENDNQWSDGNVLVGTFPYDGYPTFEEWDKEFEGYCGMGGAPSDRYYMHLPVWAAGNVYFDGAKPWVREKAVVAPEQVSLELKEEDGVYTLLTDLYEKLPEADAPFVSTEVLGMAFEPEEKFENPDGTPIVFDADYFGARRGVHPIPGPFADGKEAGKPLFP